MLRPDVPQPGATGRPRLGRREIGTRPSMGSVGDSFDNALAESFFATLECKPIDRRSFRTNAEARMAVLELIEGWYNPHRRHSALGYESPVNYERTLRLSARVPSDKPSTEADQLHSGAARGARSKAPSAHRPEGGHRNADGGGLSHNPQTPTAG